MRPELILWDWNGTLLDDVDLCVDALNRLLAGFGYPQRYDHERYRAIFGFPIEEYYVRAGFDFTKHSFAELAERTLALQELTAYPLIMLENGSMSRIFYRQFFLEHNAELKPDIEAGTTDQMLTLVRSDLGLAFVPEPMARGNLHRKRILQMNLQEAIPSRSVCLVYDPRRPLNTAAREFRHQLLESAKNKQK